MTTTRSIDDDWRRWIAENLLLDAVRAALHAVLVSHGFDSDEAMREIEAVLASPYFHGAARLRNRLRKREWALSVYGELSRMIERRERLSRDEFLSSTTSRTGR